MNLFLRNKKVAISRWNKIINKESKKIINSRENNLYKAGICGFLAGDGSVQIRKEKSFFHYQIDFFPDNKLMLDKYCDFFRRLYNRKPTVKKLGKYWSVRVTSKTIVLDITNNGKFGLLTWEPIKNSSDELYVYWLKAFFSAEGTVNKNGVRLQTINETGILEVSNILKNLDIDSKIYYYTPKKISEKKVTILVISRKYDLMNFYKKIGFWHSKKQKILKQLLDSKTDAVVAQSGTAQIL